MSNPLPCPDSVLLKAILTGSLSADEQSQIYHHLEECEQCRMSVDLMADLSNQMTSAKSSSSKFAAEPILSDDNVGPNFEVQDQGPANPPPDTAEEIDDFVLNICEKSDLPGSLGRLGQYEILNRIGRGGMGVVYHGLDTKLDRDVAIKLLKPRVAADISFVERFTREAQAAAAIVHHNVVTVHAIDEADGIPYIVMEYVAGESLQARIRRAGPLPLHLVATLGAQIADGLAAAHVRRVTHRDIKPANILLHEGTNEVRLGDFGLARAEGSDRLTKTGVVLGTPRYMAPEQARGDTVDHRSDLFSLGSVLYSMCVGRAPVSGKRQADVLSAVAQARMNPIEAIDPTLPDWLTAVIRKLHALAPNDRFQSAEHVASVLRRPLGEFDQSELATDDGWHDGTVIPTGPTAPAFVRQAEETVVESQMPRPGDLSLHTGHDRAEASETELPEASLLSSSAILVNRRRRVMAAGTVIAALCAIIPALAGFLRETPSDPPTLPDIADDPQLEEDLEPLPPMDVLIPELKFHVPAKNRWFETLQAAIDGAPEEGIVEIATNGRVETSTLKINKSVIIRPAPEHSPVIALDGVRFTEERHHYPVFQVNSGTLVLEGLDIEVVVARSWPVPEMKTRYSAVRLEGNSTRLLMAHCRVRMPGGESLLIGVQAEASRLVDIRHCEFYCGTAVGWAAPEDGRLNIESSVFVSGTGLTLRHTAVTDAFVSLSNSTFANDQLVKLLVPSTAFRIIRQQNGPVHRRFSITCQANESLFDCREAMLVLRPTDMPNLQIPNPAARPRDLATLPVYRLLAWQGDGNVYDPGSTYLAQAMNSKIVARAADTLGDWQNLWRDQDLSSREGIIRFGQNESFVPEMTNLRSVGQLRIIRIEDGQPTPPFSDPGAIFHQVGPTKYPAWRDGPASEYIRGKAFEGATVLD